MGWEADKAEAEARRKSEAKAEGKVMSTMSQLTFDDALRIAKGCTDYGGGYYGDDYETYQHGIQTVINALTSAKSNGLADSQTRILHALGE